MTAHPNTRTAASLLRSSTNIRTLGPVLLMIFGLVLAFTPMASVGITGSVGNAGVVEKGEQGCPTQAQIDHMIAQRLAWEADSTGWIGIPPSLADIAALVENCSCDLPYGNAGNAGIVEPILDQCDREEVVTTTTVAPPATDPPATDPPATDPPATEPPATEPPATDPPATDPPATDPPAVDPDGGASPVAPPTGQLPSTGGPSGTAVVGLALVALGGLLLLTARRRTITP